MTCSDSPPEIVLGHVKCPATRRHRTSFIVLVALVSMHAREYSDGHDRPARFAEKKRSRGGRWTGIERKEGSCGENAKQLKGRGAERRVRSVSHNMSQWLKPGRCQQPADFYCDYTNYTDIGEEGQLAPVAGSANTRTHTS